MFRCLNEIEKELEVLPNSSGVLERCRACHQQQSIIDAIREPETYATNGSRLVANLGTELERAYFHGSDGTDDMHL